MLSRPSPQRPRSNTLGRTALALFCGFALAAPVQAQLIDNSRERVALDTPEGWAMAWVTASSLMTGFGGTPTLAPGALSLSAELGSIPTLSEAQQRVGFGGLKDEDLNKSPLFGRLRAGLGLPAGWVLELGWTPPLKIDGARARELFALGLSRPLLERERWRLSLRAHGQYGQVQGDITCPRRLAGNPDRSINRYGCIEPSDDRIRMRYHALESNLEWGDRQGRRGHASLGFARFEPEVQVNARSAGLISQPQLASSGHAPYFAVGATQPFGMHWEAAVETLYVPLEVERRDSTRERDAYWSLRLLLRYRWGR
jgi:hypothetical protein